MKEENLRLKNENYIINSKLNKFQSTKIKNSSIILNQLITSNIEKKNQNIQVNRDSSPKIFEPLSILDTTQISNLVIFKFYYTSNLYIFNKIIVLINFL